MKEHKFFRAEKFKQRRQKELAQHGYKSEDFVRRNLSKTHSFGCSCRKCRYANSTNKYDRNEEVDDQIF